MKPTQHAPDAASLETYRPYLLAVASAGVELGLRERLDLSGVIQETFLEAHRCRAQFRGGTAEARLAWLRQILAHNLADALRTLLSEKRDVRRERPLGKLLDRSSAMLGDFLPDKEQASPSLRLRREERAIRVANALSELPEAQRQALLLHYWQDRPLSEIAARLGRSTEAVAGLLKRGIKRMRVLLDEPGESLGPAGSEVYGNPPRTRSRA